MNDVNFEKDVLEKSRKLPVVVDFWAPWCGPCKMLGPILEKARNEANGKWELIKINVDENPDLARQYGVRGIPAVKLFYNGQVADEFTGVIPEVAFQQWLKKHVPDENAAILSSIRKEIENGDLREGRGKLEAFIKKNPDNKAARLLLAKIIFRQNPQEAQDLIRDIHQGQKLFDEAEAIRTLAKGIIKLGNADQLPENPVKEDYLHALRAVKGGNWEEAMQYFLKVIPEDKKYDEEGARKAMIAIFTLLGKDHELTKKYRRRFDMSLY